MSDFAIDVLGQSGLQLGNQLETIDRGKWARESLGWPNVVIGGGTPNIQKNIIAERILGLPKD